MIETELLIPNGLTWDNVSLITFHQVLDKNGEYYLSNMTWEETAKNYALVSRGHPQESYFMANIRSFFNIKIIAENDRLYLIKRIWG